MIRSKNKYDRIACFGYYGKRNIGDDLILAELLDHIHGLAEESKVTVFSDNDDILRLIPNEMDVEIKRRSIKNLLREAMRADLFICGPGGLFPNRETIMLAVWNLIALILWMRGRKLLFLGVGIGQENLGSSLCRFLLRSMIRHSAGFSTRQEGLDIALGDEFQGSDFIVAADVILSLKPNVSLASKSNKVVGVALANIFLDEGEKEKFASEFAMRLDTLCEEGFELRLFSFTEGKDDELNSLVVNHMKHAEKTTRLSFPNNPYEIINELNKAQLVIAMRFHALVISSLLRIPCSIISYSEKLDDLAKRLAVADYLIRFCPNKDQYFGEYIPFDAERFNHILRATIKDQSQIEKKYDINLPCLVESSMRNWELLTSVVKRS